MSGILRKRPNNPGEFWRDYRWLVMPSKAILDQCENVVIAVTLKVALTGKVIPPGWIVIPSTPLPQFEIETFKINGFDMPKGIGRNE